MTEEERVLNRLKQTNEVLNGKTTITQLDFQIREMVTDCIKVIQKQQEEIDKKDKIIEQYEKECRQFKAFCRRVRRDKKHDVDLFNQGQEHKCNQFLNLISGEPHWSYAGKYFDDTDNQIKEYFG